MQTQQTVLTPRDVPAFIGWVFTCIRHASTEDPGSIVAEDPELAPWCAELGQHFGAWRPSTAFQRGYEEACLLGGPGMKTFLDDQLIAYAREVGGRANFIADAMTGKIRAR